MRSRAFPPAPKLSICIITYNRAEYLRRTLCSLAWLKNISFDYEIVVSDNCSGDGTAAVVSEIAPQFDRLRYSRRTRTVSPEDNFTAAFRMARGEFVVYLADDDALIPEAIAAVVSYMDTHPSVVACHSPWELWDQANDRSHGLFYKVDEITRFEKRNMLELFDFVIQRHIFPEIGVYRTEMMHKILYQPRKAYWAYVFLARALDHGDVVFLPYPFYRSITTHWIGETRQQHGHSQALSDWDLYRGGIEFLLQRALNNTSIPESERDRFRKAINRFIASRMKVGVRLLIEKQDYLSAFDTLARLMPWDYIREQDIAHYRQFLPVRAAAQAVIATFDAVTTLKQVGLYGIASSEKLVTLLLKIRKDLRIVDLTIHDLREVVNKSEILVLTRKTADRENLAQAGFEAGLIIVETELLAQFQL